jgi:asparagine synthase (glutamine-hydrolysing)
MCSITSFSLSPSSSLSSQDLHSQLSSSLSSLKHRGPDSHGVWISPCCQTGLGHCRLAINDLRPTAARPLHSSDGKVHAVVNGEIYGFEGLQARLQAENGYVFTTECDSEVVLALYEVHGLAFTSYLRGEVAIVIYDEKTQQFFAVRNRFGIKPLFYTEWQGKLLVAAEIKAFSTFGWKPEWDVQSLVEGGWNFDDRTIFRGVRKMRPGTTLIAEKGRMDTCAILGFDIS